MKQVKFVIYILLINYKKYQVNLTFNPRFELNYFFRAGVGEKLEAYILTKALPIGLAKYIYKEITTVQEREGAWVADLFRDVEELKAEYSSRIKKILAYYSLSKSKYVQMKKLKPEKNFSLPAREELEEIYQILAGRLLYYNEIKKALKENNIEVEASLLSLLQMLKLEDELEIRPSVAYQQRNYLVCQRCGQAKDLVEIDCNHCGLVDYYCDNCIYMGKAKSCRPLYVFAPKRRLETKRKIRPELEFDLTAPQLKASQELVDFILGPKQKALVWAVCGAGKTEVSFQAIAKILSQGGNVLFAIPRKDAVVELAPRLKKSFPDFEVSALYGGSKTKYDLAQITVATTHQVLRFINKFDLVILDEMDAFPYQGSQMLKMAVKRACKSQGKIVYMTATPGDNLADFKTNRDKILIKIPARYHGYPIPVPKLLTAELDYEKECKEVELPREIFDLIHTSIYKDLAQIFIFLPTRNLVELVGEKLQNELPQVNDHSWVQYSHAQDVARDEKREKFSQGEYPVLVSTTIMERAITVPKANVLVLFADWSFIFDTQTLTQMAGRSGRSLEYPTGEVWFVGRKITSEMRQTRNRILDLNEEARQKGYLKRGINKE